MSSSAQAESDPATDPFEASQDLASLVELLDRRAGEFGDEILYSFLLDGNSEREDLSYAELSQRARAIAAQLQSRSAPGERALLIYPPGLDFIAAFFACLCAEVAAVPLYPPISNRAPMELRRFAQDSGARLALTNGPLLEAVEPTLEQEPELRDLDWLATDAIDPAAAAAWSRPTVSEASIAFIQYTSGSTRSPRGVSLTHGNLLYNSTLIRHFSGERRGSRLVSWLPPYHDMGLIGAIVQPLFGAFPAVLMSPLSFLERPLSWLEAISRFRATSSGGPDFAFALCARRAKEEDLAGLDLSSWEVAMCGAEPVRAETVEAFTRAFEPCGFRRDAFRPAYGLAEATLIVTASRGRCSVRRFARDALEQGRVEIPPSGDDASVELVGCGSPHPEQRIVIVDPDTREPRASNQVGEIWVGGRSVAGGYWGRSGETGEVFRAWLPGTGEGPFLRTGDLGFMLDGELFVVGREKDVIIIRGRNIQAHDVEETAEGSHVALRRGCGAAFAIEAGGREQLVVVQEADTRKCERMDEPIECIRRAVVEAHGVAPYAVVLIEPRTLPKTSSGKKRRALTGERFSADELEVLAEWRAADSSPSPTDLDPPLLDREAIGEGAPATAGVAEGEGDQEEGSASKQQVALQDAEPVDERIAIVGLACRFPGAPDAHEFHRLLAEGRDAISEVPPDRWDVDAFYDPEPGTAGKMATRWGGFLEEIDRFDPQFFGIAPREASWMDPQQRLLLEVTWGALEDAGQPPPELAGTRTGVFVGIGGVDYSQLQLTQPDGLASINAYSGTGNAHSIAANRVSFVLDLRGPSVAVDTACSSALVAIHLACQSLIAGESDRAVAGGVNLVLSPEVSIAFSHARMLSTSGRCKSFDADADGYVRGEGCGVVVLRRLTDAVRDGDRILATINGSAVNQDGLTPGIAAPRGEAQQAAIREALRRAKAAPDQLGYVEAHGTGTPLGDPVEADALVSAIGKRSGPGHTCGLGSVKANVGHLETASGVAGLIKVVLALQHEVIYGQPNFERLNPRIDLEASPLTISTERSPWPAGETPRLAGVSSFGFGGTNAHLIVGEAPPATAVPRPGPERPRHVLPLSARSRAALRRSAERARDRLAEAEPGDLADLCHTAARGRAHFEHRLALEAGSVEELREALLAATDGDAGLEVDREPATSPPKVGFLFTGQGSQYPGMAKRLYDTQPTFRRTVDSAAEILEPELDHPLLAVLFDTDDGGLIHRTRFTQPALFAIEYALAELWASWGVRPAAAAGHSVGEYVAACVAGVFDFEQGLRLIAERARLMDGLPEGGAMAVVHGDEAQVLERIAEYEQEVSVAAINAPGLITVSGPVDAIEAVLAKLREASIRGQRLKVSHAFHSRLMDPIIAPFERAASGFSFQPPTIPLISNLTGRPLGSDEAIDARYLARHMRNPVRFAEGMRSFDELGCTAFLELGPHPALIPLGRRCLPGPDRTWLSSLERGRDDWETLLGSTCRLYERGAEIDWSGFDRGYPRRIVSFPAYPFARDRYWIETSPGASRRAVQVDRRNRVHPLLGTRLRSPLPSWENRLSQDELGYLEDHRVQGECIFPAAGFLELALAAAKHAVEGDGVALAEVEFHRPLALPAEGARATQLVLAEGSPDREFQIWSRSEEESSNGTPDWSLHASGTIRTDRSEGPDPVDLAALKANATQEIDGQELYSRLRSAGLDYGPSFRGVRRIWQGEGEALAEVEIDPDISSRDSGYEIHPAILDSGLHVLAAAIESDPERVESAYLPVGAGRFRVIGDGAIPRWSHAVLRPAADGLAGRPVADVRLLDQSGRAVAEIEGFELQALDGAASGDHTTTVSEWLYSVRWEAQELAAESPHTEAAGSCLLISTREATGRALASQLRDRGLPSVVATAGSAYRRMDGGGFEFDPERPEQVKRLLADLDADGSPPEAVVDLRLIDRDEVDENVDAETLEGLAAKGYLGALHLVQALVANGGPSPRLWFATTAATPVNDRGEDCSLEQAPLTGFAAAAAQEIPEMRPTIVDLDPESSHRQLDRLAAEVAAGNGEKRISLRDDHRYVARLVRHADASSDERADGDAEPGLSLPPRGDFQLRIDAPGVLDKLVAHSARRRPPGPGEVELEVAAAGLNFRDVMKALGMYPSRPGDPLWLGDECAGRIVAKGEQVEGLEIGDRVAAVAPAAFASHATTRADYVARIPDGLGAEDAATIPIAFSTAWYALLGLARLEAGERVLIHAAAGGVGNAAVQIALWKGAEVFATAGSEEKRSHVRSLGVQHVFDSRSTAFADQILELTDGEGVDVALNSLAGEFVPKTLSVLHPGGRFLEIGKVDIYSNSKLGMRQLADDVSFFAIDMDVVFRRRPKVAGGVLREAIEAIDRGELKPLPKRSFQFIEARQAFRFLAQARNIGKVVLEMPRPAKEVDGTGAGRKLLDGDGSCLITGAFGSLGATMAEWLAGRGVKHLALLGRRGATGDGAEALERLAASGIELLPISADVSDDEQLDRALTQIRETMPPLRGVVHAAGVLDDAILPDLSPSSFATVMVPKLRGAWNLHRLTAEDPIELFVLISSAASVIGSAGQANYAAANAFLDGLAHFRRARGLAALSVNWGPWSTGMASRTGGGARFEAVGFRSIDPERGMEALEAVIDAEAAQALVLPADWARVRSALPALGADPLVGHLSSDGAEPSGRAPDRETRERILAADPAERKRMVEDYLRRELAVVLQLDADSVDSRRSLRSVGLDSLMSLELKNRVEDELEVSLSMMALIECDSISDVADELIDALAGSGAAPDAAPVVSSAAP